MNKVFPNYTVPWPEPLVPDYKPAKAGRWRCVPTPETPEGYRVIGYWRPSNYIPPGWMFEEKQRSNSKWRKWMSLTPMEQESHQPHIAAAKGTVVVAGLGMGFYLFNILRKPEVNKVIVLENNKMVMELFIKSIHPVQWAKWWSKLEIINIDALQYKPGIEVDFLYADIWPQLGDYAAYPMTFAMQHNIQAKEVGYWGQEFDFMSWMMKNNKNDPFDTNLTEYLEFCDEMGLPLCERDNPRYPLLAVAAVTMQTVGTMMRKPKSEYEHRSSMLLLYKVLKVLENGAYS